MAKRTIFMRTVFDRDWTGSCFEDELPKYAPGSLAHVGRTGVVEQVFMRDGVQYVLVVDPPVTGEGEGE
jgi:hypothetical protein